MPFEIIRNDITKMQVDAIVNPTNPTLFGTAGIDGRLHNIEGPRLREETATFGTLELGQCVVTKAYRLPAGHIIHTAGPVWKGGQEKEEEILRNCYRNALMLAQENHFETVAFPLIASGVLGFPKDIALNIAVRTIGEFLLFHEMIVYLVVYDKQAYQLSADLYRSVREYIDDNYIQEQPILKMSRRFEELEGACYEAAKPVMDVREVRQKKKSIKDLVIHLDETFSEMLQRLIDEKGLTDPEVYKKANVTKQTFSKIRNNSQYSPTKQTVLAFAIALELSLDEAKDLLLKAGFALSNSNRFDVIMSYFFERKNYDIHLINEVLFEYDENLLGL